MTKQELIKMTGSEEQANYALEILLKHVKPAFVRAAIHAELKGIEDEIKGFLEQGYLYTVNGMQHVAWSKAENLNGWHLTPEQQAAYDAEYAMCQKANAILYTRNRVTDLIAYRG